MTTPSQYIVTLAICLFISVIGFGQSDTLIIKEGAPISEEVLIDDVQPHSPKKATILSAVLPSAGQFYNKKYWKMPIVYIGLGISVFYLDRNLGDIAFYRENLQAEIDDDPNTINITGRSQSDMTRIINDFKRLRDLSYFAIAGVYILQIVDANVDAHLWSFDVSDDLSVTAMPSMILTDKALPGLSLSIKF